MKLRPVIVRQGDKFPLRYVDLHIRHFREDRPLLMTDRAPPIGIDCLPLRHGLPGWWSKMELFSPEVARFRPFVFFDLDTYVLSSIDDILSDRGDKFLMLDDFYNPGRPASGMMVIPKDTRRIWDAFKADRVGAMNRHASGGDQEFLAPFCEGFLQEKYHGITSYKVHSREAPAGRIVCFHGFPKPHECDGWAGDEWRSI